MRLQGLQAEVRVVATEAALKFMQPGDVPQEALFGVRTLQSPWTWC